MACHLIDFPPFRSFSKQDLFLCLCWTPLIGFQGPVLWNQLCLSPLTRTGRTLPPYLSNYWCLETWNQPFVPRVIEPVWVYIDTFVYSLFYGSAQNPHILRVRRQIFEQNRSDTDIYSVVFFPQCVPGIDRFFYFQSRVLTILFDLAQGLDVIVNCLWFD